MKNVDRVNEALFSFTWFSIDRSLFNFRQVSVIRRRHDGRFTFHLSFDIVRRIGHFVTGVHCSDVLKVCTASPFLRSLIWEHIILCSFATLDRGTGGHVFVFIVDDGSMSRNMKYRKHV